MVGYCSIGRVKAAIAARQHDDDGDDPGEDRAVDEEARHAPFMCAYGLHALARAAGVTGMSGINFLRQALHDQLVAGLQAVQHLPVAAHGAAGLENPEARDVVVVHHQGGGLAFCVVADAAVAAPECHADPRLRLMVART